MVRQHKVREHTRNVPNGTAHVVQHTRGSRIDVAKPSKVVKKSAITEVDTQRKNIYCESVSFESENNDSILSCIVVEREKPYIESNEFNQILSAIRIGLLRSKFVFNKYVKRNQLTPRGTYPKKLKVYFSVMNSKADKKRSKK